MISMRFENAVTALTKFTDEISEYFSITGLREQLRLFRPHSASWPALRIGNLVARVPIVQGGMGVGVSLSGLASAVANAGGIGVIAANAIGMIERDYFKDGRGANIRALRREIQTARKQSRGILGVNIMVAVNDFREMLDVSIDEGVDLVFMGAGLPVKDLPVAQMRKKNVKAVPIVSSVRAVELIFRMWKKLYNDVPDAVVFEGPLAGGHIGFTEEQVSDPDYQLESIVPGIVECLKPYEEEFHRAIPVIAGGGVFSGKDIHRVLQLGASAVQMGTRFVATDECDAAPEFKQAFVNCSPDDIGIIKSPVGMPGRAIRSEFILASERGERPAFKCAWKCLSTCKADDARYCISIALNNARQGKLKNGFVFAGTNAYRVTEVVPVTTLINTLDREYQEKSRLGLVPVLEMLLTGIQDLKKQYDDLAARLSDAAGTNEYGLPAQLRKAGETGRINLRRQYDTTLSGLRSLKRQILDRLTDSWSLLNTGRIPF